MDRPRLQTAPVGLRRWDPDDLTPPWRAWLEDPGSLPPGVRCVGPSVYELPELFSESFLARLTAEVQQGLAESRGPEATLGPPNSMHRAGFVLAERGLGVLLDQLGEVLLGPLGRRLYPRRDLGEVVAVHGFVAHYGPEGDRALDFHVDESDLTLTLCLGDVFEGSAVYFEGLRCGAHLQTPARPEECFQYIPTPGAALVHLGAHRHGVRPILAGARTSVILWARSSGPGGGIAHGRLGPCPAWCGLH